MKGARRFSMSISVRGLLQQLRAAPPGGESMLQDVKTKESLTNTEALAYLAIEQAKGHEMLPCSAECGNPCTHADRGCDGFDYKRGCPGYSIDAEPARAA